MKRPFYLYYLIIIIFLSLGCQQREKIIPVIVNSEDIIVELDSVERINREIDSIIAIYKDSMQNQMNVVVGKTKNEIDKQKPSGPLDNLFADMMYYQILKQTNVEISGCVYNYFGIRRPLPKGSITMGNVYELMPFNNYTVLLHLNPRGMKGMFKYLYKTEGQPTSNFNIEYRDSINYTILIGGEKWDTTSSYWILTSDYAANGGDNMNFFQDNDSVINTGILVRDAIFSYLDSLQQRGLFIEADTIPRIIFKNTN